VVEPQFPLWAFIVLMVCMPVLWIFLWFLARRLRGTSPTTWEKLGRPSGSMFVWVWPGSIGAAFEKGCSNWLANLRLLLFPLRAESFRLTDRRAVILLWSVRVVLVLIAIFGFWSWRAN
jgi:hypothetical protein